MADAVRLTTTKVVLFTKAFTSLSPVECKCFFSSRSYAHLPLTFRNISISVGVIVSLSTNCKMNKRMRMKNCRKVLLVQAVLCATHLPGCSDIGSVFPSHIAGESEGEVSAMASSVFPETLPLCSPANVEVGLGNEWSPSSPLSSLQVVTATIFHHRGKRRKSSAC